ncbi:MAG: hypothetical protein ACR2NN_14230 [Bryobacteraceae bacterium]
MIKQVLHVCAPYSQYISGIAQEEITVAPAEVERLRARFGEMVPQMGRWQADGSLVIDGDLIREAAVSLRSRELTEAATALMESFASPSAAILIERISELNKLRFRELCQRYQEATNPAEEEAMKQEIIRQVFPS